MEAARRSRRARSSSSIDQRPAAFLGAVVLIGYLAASGGGFGSSSFGRAGFVVWVALALTTLFSLMPATRPAKPMPLVLMLLVGFIGWTALSLIWSESAERTVNEIDRLVCLAGVLVLVAYGLRREAWRSAASGLSIAVIGIAFLAAVFRILPDLAPAAATGGSLVPSRLAFPIDYWNGLACICAMAVCAGVGWATHASSPGLRGASLATVPVSGTALYLTYSRGGLIALAFGLAYLVLTSWDPRQTLRLAAIGCAAAVIACVVARSQHEVASGTGGSGGLIIAAVLVVLAAVCSAYCVSRGRGKRHRRTRRPEPVRLDRRFSRLAILAAIIVAVVIGIQLKDGGTGSESTPGDPASRLLSFETNRSHLWGSALDAFSSHPLNGVGAGSYGLWLSHDPGTTALAANAHSLPLETAAELGLPGLLLLAAFFVALVRAAASGRAGMKRKDEYETAGVMGAFFVVFAVQSLIDWMWQLELVAILGLGSLAVVAASASRNRSSGRRAMRGRGLVFAGCLGLAIVQVPGLVAAEKLDLSQGAASIGFFNVAAESAHDASTAAPWSASAHAQSASIALAQRRQAVAQAEARKAVDLEPDNWEYRALAARVAAAQGEISEARDDLTEMARLRPGASEIAKVFQQNPLLLNGSQSSAAP